MKIFKRNTDLQAYIEKVRQEGGMIHFVPTMGAIHEGHLSLVGAANQEHAIAVVSIFVNPSQFNDSKDFEKYPRPISEDIEALTLGGCDVLYLPHLSEIYPVDWTRKEYDLEGLEDILEGSSRPGHFQGVVNVVRRLLEIVKPDRLYLGQKDLQQVAVLKFLVEKLMTEKVEIIVCPIEREETGLARSSRNVRLSTNNRSHAQAIYQTLVAIKEACEKADKVIDIALYRNELAKLPFIEGVDYLEVISLEDLTTKRMGDDLSETAVVTACLIDGVRLIDNLIIRTILW